jgi:hypothetical protein
MLIYSLTKVLTYVYRAKITKSIRYHTFWELCAAIPCITRKRLKLMATCSAKRNENGTSTMPINLRTKLVLCSFKPTTVGRLAVVRSCVRAIATPRWVMMWLGWPDTPYSSKVITCTKFGWRIDRYETDEMVMVHDSHWGIARGTHENNTSCDYCLTVSNSSFCKYSTTISRITSGGQLLFIPSCNRS